MMLRDGFTDVQRAIAADKRRVTDAAGGTAGLHRPAVRRIADALAYDAAAEAYAEMCARLSDAWRPRDASPPPGAYPYTALNEGTRCTVDGEDGTLMREGDYLVCKPVR